MKLRSKCRKPSRYAKNRIDRTIKRLNEQFKLIREMHKEDVIAPVVLDTPSKLLEFSATDTA